MHGERLPTSSQQREIWIEQALLGDAPAFSMAGRADIPRDLDADAFHAAVALLVAETRALRTVFDDSGPELMRLVLPAAPVEHALHDLRGEADPEAALMALQQSLARRPFDLRRGPLFRSILARLAPDRHVWLSSYHHIVVDAWAIMLLVKRMGVLYTALAAGEQPEPPGWTPYARFVEEDAADLDEAKALAQRQFWSNCLAGLPYPLLEWRRLPESDPASLRSTLAVLTIPRERYEAVQALAAAHNATPPQVFLALLAIYLHRATGRDDFVIGMPVLNRRNAAFKRCVGLCTKILPLRVRIEPGMDFAGLMAHIGAGLKALFRNKSLGHAGIAAAADTRIPAGRKLYDVALSFMDMGMTTDYAGTPSPFVRLNCDHEQLGMALYLCEYNKGQGVELQIDANVGCLSPEETKRLPARFAHLLEQCLASPHAPIETLEPLPPDEQARLLALATTPALPDPPSSLPALALARAERSPEAPALVMETPTDQGGGDAMDYARLAREVDGMAQALHARGMGRGSHVGLCLSRGPWQVLALLAVMRAGAACVPLDPAYPRERLAHMAADAGLDLLLMQEDARAALPAVACPLLDLETLRRDAEALAGSGRGSPRSPLPMPGPDDRAYVLYTSGSTGLPKGVAVAHAGLASMAIAHARRFGLGPGDRVAQFSSLNFDAALCDIAIALVSGAALHLGDAEELMPGPNLAAFLRNRRITLAALTPSVLAAMVEGDASPDLPDLRICIAGGEACPADLAAIWSRGRRFFNAYGPTEITVDATLHEWTGGPMAIGRPLPGVTTYVMDGAGRLTPLGCVGELRIGGPGVAQGYLNQPELTAQRFTDDPFRPGRRLYRSGDLVRMRDDGVLEFLGRVDRQIKVRGLRIEPGEVEAALARVPGIVRAAVKADAGGQNLVAWCVPAGGGVPPAPQLRAALAATLPEHMIPVRYHALEALPLTPSGKTDLDALRDAAPEGGRFTPPRTPQEEVVAALFAEILGLERVGVEDDFFELGGHSLSAMRLVNRLARLHATALDLRAVFARPTVAVLAAHLAELQQGAEPPALEAAQWEEAPLSPAQRRLWFLHRLEGGGPVYNIPMALRLRGPLAPDALEAALRLLVERHQMLRAVVGERDAEPFLRFPPAPERILARRELPDMTAGMTAGMTPDMTAGMREARLAALLEAEMARPFDLEQGPLFRFVLVRLSDQDHVLTLAIHHIAADGWSVGILFDELGKAYAALRQGGAPELPELPELPDLPDAPVQFADIVAWQGLEVNRRRQEQQAAYWRAALAGIPELLDLPTDHPRPARPSHGGGHVEVRIPDDLASALRALARGRGVTLFAVLETAWACLLGRHGRCEDVVVGVPVANRVPAQAEGVVGLFVNTVPLRHDLSGDPSFAALLERMREPLLQALAHQEAPFERIVEAVNPARNPAHAPIFQTLFSLEVMARAVPELEGLEVSPQDFRFPVAKFDLSLALTDADSMLWGHLEYNSDIFRRSTAERFARQYLALLSQAAAGADLPLGALDCMDAAQREFSLFGPRRDEAIRHHGPLLPALAAGHAAARPEALAAVSTGRQLTYGDLEDRASRLARLLRERGVRRETLVGLCLPRIPDLLVAVLAVFKAGGAFLPLDPGYPTRRLEFMLRDSGVGLVLGHDGSAAVLPPGDFATLDLAAEEAAWMALDPLDPPATRPEDLAYVIYTSGSTGQPKGALLEHGGLANLGQAKARGLGLGPGGNILQFASLNFDASVCEMAVALAAGACLHLADEAERMPGDPLHALIRQRGVQTIILPPSALNAMHGEADSLDSLRVIVAAGEPCPAALARHWGRGRTFVNAYGPTEATVCATMWMDDGGPTTIGDPLPGVRVYILDAASRPAPLGAPGELCIAGVGVGRGYLRRPELTAERFTPDPFVPGGRMYRSGDLARRLDNGAIEYLGRLDRQLKVRGFRIEPGEVEAALRGHPEVAEAVVDAAPGPAGGTVLAAWIVPAGATMPEPARLREFLRASLPEHMIPGPMGRIDALPLSPSGKVDRGALPPLNVRPNARHNEPQDKPLNASAGFATESQRTLAAVWGEVLGLEDVGPGDNFFSLGGDSILSIRLVARARERGLALSIQDVFHHQTVAEQAAVARRVDASGEPSPAEDQDALRLTPLQEAMVLAGMVQEDDPYAVHVRLRVEGPVDPEAMARAWQMLHQAHAALRMAIHQDEEGPVGVVAGQVQARFQFTDLSGEPDADRREQLLHALVRRDVEAGFDPRSAPLARLHVARLEPERHELALCSHHVALDGWSVVILLRELARIHAGLLRGEAPQAVGVGLAGHQRWLAARDIPADLDWWARRLQGLEPGQDLRLEAPERESPPEFLELETLLPEAVTAAIQALGRREQATPAMVLEAAWAATLAGQTGTSDIVYGTVISGRPAHLPGVEDMVGMFINTIPQRVQLQPAMTLRDLLDQLRVSRIEADRHGLAPLAGMRRRLGLSPRAPLFESLLVVENHVVASEDFFHGSGLRLTALRGEDERTMPLSLIVATDRETALRLRYNAARFTGAAIQRLALRLRAVLDAFLQAGDAAGGTPLGDLPGMESVQWREIRRESPQSAPLAPASSDSTSSGSASPGSTSSDSTSDGAPRGETEQVLAGIWSTLLGLEPVRRGQDFFSLGGDSILAMRLCALARNRGLELTARQVLENPTLAGMAAVAGRVAGEAPREDLDPAPLTPIQHLYFDYPSPRSHYMLSALLRSPAGLDRKALVAALDAVLQQHAALRTRFVEHADGWTQQATPWEETPGAGALLRHVDCQGMDEATFAETIRREGERAKRSSDIETGRVFIPVWFDRGPDRRGRLLLAVHHLVVDAVSWRIFIPDLAQAYAQAASGSQPVPRRTDMSYARWARALQTAAARMRPGEIEYWRSIAAVPEPAIAPGVVTAGHCMGDIHIQDVFLDAQRTREVLSASATGLHATAHELLLASFGLGLGRWLAGRGLPTGAARISMEGHGREDLGDGLDPGRTVGWFTAQYPFVLRTDITDQHAALAQVQHDIRIAPHRKIGFGLQRFLRGDPALVAPAAVVNFNYLGQFDEVRGDWSLDMADSGPELAPERVMPNMLDAASLVQGGCLRLEIASPARVFHREEIGALLHAWHDALLRFTDLGMQRPSDREPLPPGQPDATAIREALPASRSG